MGAPDRSDPIPGFGDKNRRVHGRTRAIRLHGVAFLRGFDTPSLQAQGGQRRLPYFNRDGDIPLRGVSPRKRRGGAADTMRISHKGEEAMSGHHAKAAIMRNFKLSGQGIEINYQNNELTLSGQKIFSFGNQMKFPDAGIARVKSDIGDQ